MVKIKTAPITNPKGLLNSGNYCFANATLQCLIHHQSVSNYFGINTFNNKQQFSTALKHFITYYKNPKTNDSKNGKIYISPNVFFSRLKSKISILDGEMQDTNEFLILLLDLLINEDIVEPKNITRSFLPEFHTHKVLGLFSGMKQLNLKCSNCGECSSKIQLFRNIMIQTKDCVDLEVTNHLINDHSGSIFTCDACDQTKSKFKSLDLLYMPVILIVVVNRFLSMTEKNDAKLPIDLNIKIKDYKYQLYGIVCHKGNLKRGHYTSYVKIRNDWVHFDDETVEKGIPSFSSGSAYVLFYTRTLL